MARSYGGFTVLHFISVILSQQVGLQEWVLVSLQKQASLSLAKLLALVREASCCTGMDTCQYWGGRGGVSTLGLQQQSCKFVPLIPRCWAGWRALHTKGTCKLPERSLHQCNIHWPTLHTAPVLMLGIHLVSLAFGGYALLLKSHHNWCQ